MYNLYLKNCCFPPRPFGFGLAYTTFNITSDGPSLNSFTTGTNTTFSLQVHVTNVGKVAGDEVVQVYMAPKALTQRTSPLQRQLIGFQRLHLNPSMSATASFHLCASAFNIVATDSGDIVSTPGTYNIIVTNGVNLSKKFNITLSGKEVIVEPFPHV